VAPYEKGDGLRHNLQIRVPVDDTHTQVYRVNFLPSDNTHSAADADTPFHYSQLKTGPRQYDMKKVSAQDSMAWETQGAVTDRRQEHLGVADEGIILLRRLLKEQIEIVQQGRDPLGVIRDAEKNRIIEFDVINERIGLYRAQRSEQDRRTTEFAERAGAGSGVGAT
jgi:5,5'-dehydrodivanillate O-demethylase